MNAFHIFACNKRRPEERMDSFESELRKQWKVDDDAEHFVATVTITTVQIIDSKERRAINHSGEKIIIRGVKKSLNDSFG